MSHICHILNGNTWEFTCIYELFMTSTALIMCPGVLYAYFKKYISCYLHILLNKYGYHIAHIGYTVLILYWNIDPAFVYICVKEQPTTAQTLHLIAIHVSETDMPSKFYIDAIYLTCIHEGCMFTYVSLITLPK